MKKDLARWVVTFCAAMGGRAPRSLFPGSWRGALERAEAEERDIECRLRAPLSEKEIPDSLHMEIDRVLRREPARDSAVAWRAPTIAITAAAAIILAVGGLCLHRIHPPAVSPVASFPPAARGETLFPGVELPAEFPQEIASIPADWERLLREEQERIAADGITAIRFLAANFVPETFMCGVDAQLEKWDARVTRNR